MLIEKTISKICIHSTKVNLLKQFYTNVHPHFVHVIYNFTFMKLMIFQTILSIIILAHFTRFVYNSPWQPHCPIYSIL